MKRQLNVVTRRLVHGYLQEIAVLYSLRGKGEAVTFTSFVTKFLLQQSAHNVEAERLLALCREVYHRNREFCSA
ncbi:MAG: hypothetical protein FD153_754 [Rhodospirillaceae bacterium]|nr:MAG: hypothetical protein FD153_754 [Rhodospirillaceae bacterium]